MTKALHIFLTLCLSLAVIPAIAQELHFSSPPTLEEVSNACAENDPQSVVQSMIRPTFAQWDAVIGFITSGSTDWLHLFSTCLIRGLGESSIEQTEPLILALPNNAPGVLAVLQADTWSLPRVCCMGITEADFESTMHLSLQGLQALNEVNEPELNPVRDQCLDRLHKCMDTRQTLQEDGLYNHLSWDCNYWDIYYSKVTNHS